MPVNVSRQTSTITSQQLTILSSKVTLKKEDSQSPMLDCRPTIQKFFSREFPISKISLSANAKRATKELMAKNPAKLLRLVQLQIPMVTVPL